MTVIGTLVVVRPAGSGPSTYRIVVDGQVKGTVAAGHELTLALAPGTHQVRAQLEWTGSPDVDVHVGPGATTTVRVEPRSLRHALSRAGYLSLTLVD